MGGSVSVDKEEEIERDLQKKRERFEAARQVAMQEAMIEDTMIQSRQKQCEADVDGGSSVTASGRGYDKLTIFPEGDRDMELITSDAAEHVEQSSV